MPLLAPELADAHLVRLLAEFERTGSPVDVCFRDLVPGPTIRDRARQDLHPYPARLLVNIPAFFLSTSLTKPGDLVADPFCGSGTVLLEAIQAGRNAAGADANPLARLISKVKATPASDTRLKRALARLIKAPAAPRGPYPDVVNIEYWFYPHVRRELLSLLAIIKRTRDNPTRDVLTVAFSACVKEVSLADPRLSVPVRLRTDQYPSDHWLYEKTITRLAKLKRIDVTKLFAHKLRDVISRLSVCPLHSTATLKSLDADARNLQSIGDGEADLVLTSPPYLGAQKYIRASSLSLTWLSLCGSRELRTLEDQNIGREHFHKEHYTSRLATGIEDADRLIEAVRANDSLRAHIASIYLLEMRASIRECARVLRPGGHLILIAGASSLKGTRFPTPVYLSSIAEESGFHLRLHLVDRIRSRSLMTKRHHTAGSIDSESILMFRRDK